MTSQDSDGVPFDEELFEIHLIDEVKIRPIFYYKGHQDFYNKLIKEDEWNLIAGIINSTNNYNYLTGKWCE